jgi:hypothetical protein
VQPPAGIVTERVIKRSVGGGDVSIGSRISTVSLCLLTYQMPVATTCTTRFSV